MLISLMFVGLGQVLGRAFNAAPNRVMAYTLNIGGSVAGIVGFAILSLVQAQPWIWFLISGAGVAYLLYRRRNLGIWRIAALVGLVALVTAPDVAGRYQGSVMRWSPYYLVKHDVAEQSITVNTISHQTMAPFDKSGSPYSLIHLLQAHSGGKPFQDMLVVGAGSGNDLDHALRFGVGRIDAVEIDPVIQDIGITRNPDRPYQDPRVVRHLDDGRHFLRTTDRKYDLVVYALVDSLVLHSGYSDLRLESYLFTEQAFADIKRVLKSDGIFVTYNFFRQGWIVERVAAMAERVFGCKPIVLSLPYRESLGPDTAAGFTMIVASCAPRITEAFDQRHAFWLNKVPPANIGVDGFTVQPDAMPPDQRDGWQKIAPTTLVHDGRTPVFSTDDWPFPYLHARLIPDLSIRSMIMLGIRGLVMVYLFLPKGRIRVNNRMFFLGAAFMLLETKAVVQLALLFGSTWLVNTMVFFTVLVLILLANLFVLRIRPTRLLWYYAGLFVSLGAGVLVPFDAFLGGPVLWRYVVPCLLALGPMFFAGVIFATSFQRSADPDRALGSNIAGSVLGGLSESFSMLLGFRHLLLLAMLFYLISTWTPSFRGGKSA